MAAAGFFLVIDASSNVASKEPAEVEEADDPVRAAFHDDPTYMTELIDIEEHPMQESTYMHKVQNVFKGGSTPETASRDQRAFGVATGTLFGTSTLHFREKPESKKNKKKVLSAAVKKKLSPALTGINKVDQ